jgi:hypothetical protein
MKATKSLAIAGIAMPVLASNAFALFRSPYSRKATGPDTIIVTTDDRHDSVRSTVQISK